jgi:hypothetical protein
MIVRVALDDQCAPALGGVLSLADDRGFAKSLSAPLRPARPTLPENYLPQPVMTITGQGKGRLKIAIQITFF